MKKSGFFIVFVFLGLIGPHNSLSALTLKQVYQAAAQKGHPTRFFREIATFEGWDAVSFGQGEWPSYRPFWNQVVLPKTMHKKSPTRWSHLEWANAYNEIFHAWWDLVFEEQSLYDGTRKRLQAYDSKYAEAYPYDPQVALEEAFSETVASVIMLHSAGVAWEKMVYKKGWTISPVSHSDRPGYTAIAEETYPSEAEYGLLFFWLFGKNPPQAGSNGLSFDEFLVQAY